MAVCFGPWIFSACLVERYALYSLLSRHICNVFVFYPVNSVITCVYQTSTWLHNWISETPEERAILLMSQWPWLQGCVQKVHFLWHVSWKWKWLEKLQIMQQGTNWIKYIVYLNLKLIFTQLIWFHHLLQRLHCGCIASKSMLELLDGGGVECINCMKNSSHSPVRALW